MKSTINKVETWMAKDIRAISIKDAVITLSLSIVALSVITLCL